MKSIKVSKSQVEKLKTMALKLFPEYKIFEFSEKNGMVCLITGNKKYNIHWYELCIIHLCKKIGNSNKIYPKSWKEAEMPYDESDLRAIIMFHQEWIRNFHAIDYLYKFYKIMK